MSKDCLAGRGFWLPLPTDLPTPVPQPASGSAGGIHTCYQQCIPTMWVLLKGIVSCEKLHVVPEEHAFLFPSILHGAECWPLGLPQTVEPLREVFRNQPARWIFFEVCFLIHWQDDKYIYMYNCIITYIKYMYVWIYIYTYVCIKLDIHIYIYIHPYTLIYSHIRL